MTTRIGRGDDSRVQQRSLDTSSRGSSLGNIPNQIFNGGRSSNSIRSSVRQISLADSTHRINGGHKKVRFAEPIVEQRPLDRHLQAPQRVAQRPLDQRAGYLQAPQRVAQRPLNSRPYYPHQSHGRVSLFHSSPTWRRRTNTFYRILSPPRYFTYHYWFPRKNPTVEVHIGNPVHTVGRRGIDGANQRSRTNGLAARIALIAAAIFIAAGLTLGIPEFAYAGVFMGCLALFSMIMEEPEENESIQMEAYQVLPSAPAIVTVEPSAPPADNDDPPPYYSAF